MKNEMYLVQTNGYAAIAIHYGKSGRWYVDTCYPNGMFGGVALPRCDKDEENNVCVSSLASQAAEYFPDEDDMIYGYVEAYDGLSADDIEAKGGCRMMFVYAEEA